MGERVNMVRVLLGFGLLIAGCGETYVPFFADIETDRDLDPDAVDFEGDPWLIPGIFEEQLFSEVEGGGEMHIIHGFQGGVWVHLSIRVNGMRSLGRIKAGLGEDHSVGETQYDLRLSRTAEGYLEAYDIPIPISYRGDDLAGHLESLYGVEHPLNITFRVQDRSVSDQRLIVLQPG